MLIKEFPMKIKITERVKRVLEYSWAFLGTELEVCHGSHESAYLLEVKGCGYRQEVMVAEMDKALQDDYMYGSVSPSGSVIGPGTLHREVFNRELNLFEEEAEGPKEVWDKWTVDTTPGAVTVSLPALPDSRFITSTEEGSPAGTLEQALKDLDQRVSNLVSLEDRVETCAEEVYEKARMSLSVETSNEIKDIVLGLLEDKDSE